MTTVWILIVALLLGGTWAAWRFWSIRSRSVERLRAYGAVDHPEFEAGRRAPLARSWLTRWLAKAGYVSVTASTTFTVTSAAALFVGLLVAGVAAQPVVRTWLAQGLRNVPGGLGGALTSVAAIAPWILLVLLASAPWLVVRAARERRVLEVERDLPLLLELLATLAEAGLGFDAALDRVIGSDPIPRPLASEWRTFQRELLAGVPRLQALRLVARRLDVGSVTVFVSALVQAEQVGASLTETLRHQADDLRERRRQRALMLAQALPVKLVFPLVLCFLPGIFVAILGPALAQLVQVSEGILRGYR